jgi:hypothetical protein
MTADPRQEPRFDSRQPVVLSGMPARTQNMSATGVYFETDLDHEVGAPIRFTVEFSIGGRPQTVHCEGTVVRVDRRGQRVGVAARVATPLLAEAERIEA